MSNGDVEARVAAAVEAWQAADWPEAARRAQHALAVGAPVPLLHVLMSSLLRTGDAKQAHRIGESLAGTTSSWDVALARRTLGELSGEGLFAEAPRQSRRLAEAWLVHGERLITEGKAELGALALREAPLVSPLTPYLLIYRSLPVPTDSPRARVMAELRRTVAGDQHAAAVEQARRLLALIDACGESVLPDRPLALSALGIALLRSGQIADAVRTGPAALEAAEHLLGPVHPYMIQAVQNLASILRGAGRLSEAEPLARLALRRAQEALDPNSKEQLLALAYDNLGTLLVARAQHMEESGGETGPLLAEGCEHLREALDRWSRLFGTGHAQCRRTLSSLAIAQQRAGEAEAAATSQRQIDQDLDSGEASHTHDDQVLNNAATAAGRAKDWKRAATLYRRSVDLARANGIGRTPALAARLADLAIALGWLDQPMAAFEATQEAAFVDDLLIGQIFSIASTDERAQLLKEVRARDNRMLSLVSSWLSSEVWRLIEADTSGLGENPESTVGANAEVRRFVRSTIAVVAGTVLQRKGLSVEALSVRWEAMMARRHPEMTGALHELRELELAACRT